MVRLKLYVVGAGVGTRAIERDLRRMCDDLLDQNYQLEVVDVLEKPQEAEDQHIVATPTVVRIEPLPRRRIIGDLSNRERVAVGLELIGEG